MATIDQCAPEVQTLARHAGELSAKINYADGRHVPFDVYGIVANANGVVSAFVNPPLRYGRPCNPPTIEIVKYIDWLVCDAIRRIV